MQLTTDFLKKYFTENDGIISCKNIEIYNSENLYNYYSSVYKLLQYEKDIDEKDSVMLANLVMRKMLQNRANCCRTGPGLYLTLESNR